MTLIEVSVALLVLVLAATLVAPSFRAPPAVGTTGFARVAAEARLVAVRRAQPLTLAVDSAGRWTLRADDGSMAGSGTMALAVAAGTRLRLTALGACIVERGAPALASAWNAATCAPVPGSTLP